MPDGPVQHDVDMVAYDAALVEAGFEFVDDLEEHEEPVTELTFLAEPNAPARHREESAGSAGDVREAVATVVMSHDTLVKVTAVVEAAETNP